MILVIVCCCVYNKYVPTYESELNLPPIAHSEKDERDGTMEAETEIDGVLTVLTALTLPFISAAAGYFVIALSRNWQPHTIEDRLGPKWVRSLLGGYIFLMARKAWVLVYKMLVYKMLVYKMHEVRAQEKSVALAVAV